MTQGSESGAAPAETAPAKPSTRRAVVWGLVDQAASSGTNFALSVLAGRLLGPGGLGIVFIGFATYLIALGFLRALVADPLVVGTARLKPEERREATRYGLTAVIVLALGSSGIIALLGTLLPGKAGQGLLLVAPWVGPALVQDIWRSILFRDERAEAATANDGVWVLGTALAAVPALALHTRWAVMASWGIGSAAGAVLGFFQTGLRPGGLAGALRWWKEQAASFGGWLALEHVVVQLGAQSVVFVIASILGVAAVGGLRSVEAVFAPMTLIGPAIYLPGVPAMSRTSATSMRQARALAVKLSLAATGLLVAYYGVLGPFRGGVIALIFGQAFRRFAPLMIPIAMGQLCAAAASGGAVLLIARKMGQRLVVSRIIANVGQVGLVVVLAQLYGIRGAAWGLGTGLTMGSASIAYNAWRESRLGVAEEPLGACHRPGGLIVVSGPDGSGKSTFSDRLAASLDGAGVMRMHHRPGILPLRGGASAASDPHGDPPYGPLRSSVKLAYLFADHVLGWTFKFKPHIARGGWVVMERGWWDLKVDPRRYRLRAPAALTSLLGSMLPKPTLTVVLEAPAEVLAQRKQELPEGELHRQAAAWRGALGASSPRLFLDATLPVDRLASTAGEEIERIRPKPARMGWAGLPSRGDPRWILPRGPRAVALSGLLIYHPVTVRGLIAWRAARVAAFLGAFRLLPRIEPPEAVAAALDAAGAGDSAFAAARGLRRNRWVAMLVAEDGTPASVIRLALDEEGRDALERSGGMLRRFGSRLATPLYAPRIQRSCPGALFYEPAIWHPRLRPWRIPSQVAAAMGTFHVSGASGAPEAGGTAHGDFAPWNLLATARGWALIDWESARDGSPPYYDLFHYLVQSHALLHRPTRGGLLRALQGRGWVARAIEAYAGGAGREPADAPSYFVDYLQASLAGIDPSTPDGKAEVRARMALLHRTSDP